MSNSASPPVIVLKKLKKRFGVGDAEHYALDGVDLTIEKGEFIAIMGPSGCGKTTLLNVLGLLDSNVEGEYELDGKSIASLSARKQARIRSDQIGFVFQSFNLISRLNIIDNVALPLIYKGLSKLQREKLASKILHDFHLGEREFYMPSQLSGGQMQRVAIARALVNNPSIILADEPTGNLDRHTARSVYDLLLEQVVDQGASLIMVTHDHQLAENAAKIYELRDGQLACPNQTP